MNPKYSLLEPGYYLKVKDIKDRLGINNLASILKLPHPFVNIFLKGQLSLIPYKYAGRIRQFVAINSIRLRIKEASIYVLPRLLKRYGIINTKECE